MQTSCDSIDPIGVTILYKIRKLLTQPHLTGSKSYLTQARIGSAQYKVHIPQKYTTYTKVKSDFTYEDFRKAMYIDAIRRYDSLYLLYSIMLQKRHNFQVAVENELNVKELEAIHSKYVTALLYFHQVCKYVHNDCIRLNHIMQYTTIVYLAFMNSGYKHYMEKPGYCNNLCCYWYACPLHS